MKRLLITSAVTWLATLSFAGPKDQQDPPLTLPLATFVQTTSSTTSSTTLPVPELGAHDALQADLAEWTILELVDPTTPCRDWLPRAVDAGWPADREILEQLGRIIFRETRCLNITWQDPKWNGKDHGLLQVNGIHRAYVEQLYGLPFEQAMSDPDLNLNYGWILYSELEATGRCGWKPWSQECQ